MSSSEPTSHDSRAPRRGFDTNLARMAFGIERVTGSEGAGDSPVDLGDPAQRWFDDFELLETLGMGGMGTVYRARQRSLDREVAVKLMSAGLWASEDFVSRFTQEARHAARLRHPNIVTVHAIGEREQLVYYAMELVPGETLSHRLERERVLPPREGATLVRAIAEAADYAHRLDVLHLDLKPANILLDNAGTPKISDFGLARRLYNDLGITNEQVSGTPSYMAPEQTHAEYGVLTPATDVWGLGTILYECITGAPPFEADTPDATLRLVREGRVRRLRRTTRVDRDLEAICMKCLARAPTQRYMTARALADDLTRYLEGRPVAARTLNGLQRAWHWVRREPVTAGAGLGVALALLGGVAATSLEWRRAERSAASMREVNRFINEDLLATADPAHARPDMPDMLARAEARLDQGYANEPEARTQIGLSIGRIYIGLGQWQRARLRLERAHADALRSLGPAHPLTLETAQYLAQALSYDAHYAEAETLYRSLLPALARQTGPTSTQTLRARRDHALMLHEADEFEPAVQELRALRSDVATHDPAQLAEIDTELADLYTETNHWDEAMATLTSALERSRRQLGERHPEYLWQEVSLGDMLMMRGQWDQAEALFDNIHEGLVDTIGDSHPRTLTAAHYLGLIRLERGEPGAALPLLQHVMQQRLRVQGPDHNWTHYSMNRVGEALIALGRTDQAIPLLQKALASADRQGRRRQAYVLLILDNLAQAYLQRGELQRADVYLAEALQTARTTLPANNVRRGMIERTLGRLRARQGRIEEARAHYSAAERIFAEGWGTTHPWVIGIHREIAALPDSHISARRAD